MKKDIQLPPHTDKVFMAIVKEFNEDFNCDDWNAYLINDEDTEIEMAIIVSKGYDEDKMIETSLMRKTIQTLPAKSFAKIEVIMPDLFKLTNFFNVTFFLNNKIHERRFEFEKNTIKEGALRMIKQLGTKEGIVAK